MRIGNEELLLLGEKHQKWFENTTVNVEAYQIGDELYYLAIYSSKLSSEAKAYAIISRSNNKKDALMSLLPHFSYSISHNNLLEGAYERSKVDLTTWNNICDYILDVVENNPIDEKHQKHYESAHNVMQAVTRLQTEMKQLWEQVDKLTKYVVERGYFCDEDVDFLNHAVIKANLIKFKQIKIQYDHCENFDVIYANRNNYKSYGKIFDIEILREMTSIVAKDDLQASLKSLSLNEDINKLSETELYNRWLNNYKKQLKVRVSNEKKKLRYP